MASTAGNPLPEVPPEVLVHIFRHLPVSGLRTARLTCLRWNAVIRDSALLMKRFELFIGQRLLERFGKEHGLLDQVLLFKSLGGVSFVRTTNNPLEVIGPFWNQFGATLQKVIQLTTVCCVLYFSFISCIYSRSTTTLRAPVAKRVSVYVCAAYYSDQLSPAAAAAFEKPHNFCQRIACDREYWIGDPQSRVRRAALMTLRVRN
uniref:(northern house mosquito) hypothetical protein n=1 Tax=Culex pipiens TaxID=7175 RepID=A0A8D8GQL0_CULPI